MSTRIDKKRKAAPENGLPKALSIAVRFQETGAELNFKIERTKRMEMVMNTAAFHVGIAMSRLCFRWQNQTVCVDDTAASLGLGDQDIIECIQKGKKIPAKSVTFCIRGPDPKVKTYFILKSTTEMKHLFDACARHMDVAQHRLRFLKDGEEMGPQQNQTPETLGIENNYTIDCMWSTPNSCGRDCPDRSTSEVQLAQSALVGPKAGGAPTTSTIVSNPDVSDSGGSIDTVMLRVRFVPLDTILDFKVHKTSPMKKLMNAFADRNGIGVCQLRFVVKSEKICPFDTVKSLQLVDSDIITCTPQFSTCESDCTHRY